jgi:plasmid stability protein
MPNLSIKNVPDEIVAKLRERAVANHRSLQGELMALVYSAVVNAAEVEEEVEVEVEVKGKAAYKPAAPDCLESGWKSVDEILADRIDEHARPVTRGPRAVDIIRRERDAR